MGRVWSRVRGIEPGLNPQALKRRSIFNDLAARLKSCPSRSSLKCQSYFKPRTPLKFWMTP